MPAQLKSSDDITTKLFESEGGKIAVALKGEKLWRVSVCTLDGFMTRRAKLHDNGNFCYAYEANKAGEIIDYFDEDSRPTHTIMNVPWGGFAFYYQDVDDYLAGEMVAFQKDETGKPIYERPYRMDMRAKVHQLHERVVPMIDILNQVKLRL